MLIILIGWMGTLTDTAVYRLLEFELSLSTLFAGSASFVTGAIYVAIVLFVPYEIVGTWQQKSFEIKRGRGRLMKLFNREKSPD